MAFVEQTSAEVGPKETGTASNENSQERMGLSPVEPRRELAFRLLRHLRHAFGVREM